MSKHGDFLLDAMNSILARLMVLTLCTAPSVALACGCSNPKSVEEVRNGALIFEGRIVSVSKHPGGGRGVYFSEDGEAHLDVASQEVVFEVSKVLKGPRAERLRVHFNEAVTSCDLKKLEFNVGDEFRLSVSYEVEDISDGAVLPSAHLINNFCDLRHRI